LIHLLGNLAAFTAAGSALLFCFLYHLSARWWTSPEGRHLMSFTALLGLVFAFSSYRIAVAQVRPLPTGDEIARTVIFWLVASSLLWRLLLLWRAQIRPAFRRDSSDA
jgi:hypothetical protein